VPELLRVNAFRQFDGLTQKEQLDHVSKSAAAGMMQKQRGQLSGLYNPKAALAEVYER
jgi:hypothetical protein